MKQNLPVLSIFIWSVLLCVASSPFIVSCRDKIEKPGFDGSRAFVWLEKQVEAGPRNPGSPGWHAFQEILQNHLDSLHLEYQKQAFDYFDYLKLDTLHLVNWIVKINPEKSDRILIGAHYDCRPRAEYDPDSTRRDEPIPGANDGASGTAVLMHLAEIMATSPPRAGVDLVFFDGEDYGPPARIDQYLLGSSHFAGRHGTKYRYGIVIDLIGDSDLRIYRERFSDRYAKSVNDKIWQAAKRLGVTAFVDSAKYDIIDDHLSLIPAGIPTVTVIDFEYQYWHTHADTPDKCSPASLEAVGRVITEVIYEE